MRISNTNAINMIKYFFSLDWDELYHEIQSKLVVVSSSDEQLDIIFNIIYDAAYNYTEYIAGTNKISLIPFFGENNSSEFLTGLSQLLYISLKNNCIIHSYLSALHQTSEALEVRAKNEKKLIYGYYATEESDTSTPQIKGDTYSAIYSSKFSRARNNLSLYSNSILHTINPSIEKIRAFKVPNYVACAYNFLLYKNEVATFNRALAKTESNAKNNHALITSYSNLYKKYIEAIIPSPSQTETSDRKAYDHKITLSDERDKFLYYLELNAVYGFDVVQNTYSFLSDLNFPSSVDYHGSTIQTENDLYGKALLNILHQVCNLPLYYNKFIFFNYAIEAVKKNKNLDSSYLNQNTKEIMRRRDEITSLPDAVGKAYALMRQYFLILSEITIPLLYTLWDTILPSLLIPNLSTTEDSSSSEDSSTTEDSSSSKKEEKKVKTPEEKYCDLLADYITSHYNVFTKSLDTHDRDFIEKLGKTYKHPESTQFSLYKTFVEKINTLPELKDDFFDILSTSTNAEMANIIRSICNTDTLCKYRFPFFKLREKEYYIPIQSLVESTISPLHLGNGATSAPLTPSLNTLITEHLNTLQRYVSLQPETSPTA